MRVASQVPRFTIPVLDLAVVAGDVGVTSVVMGEIDVMVEVIDVVGMVMVISVVGVVMGIDILVVGNVVVVTCIAGACIAPVVGSAFFREGSPLLWEHHMGQKEIDDSVIATK